MRKYASIVVGLVVVAAFRASLAAQTPQAAPSQPPAVPIPAPTFHYQGEPDPRQADPGVAFVTVMDRPEVRVLRVEVQPGGARRTHTHEDVTFHLLIPVNGTLDVTTGSEVVQARPAQVYFMKAGTPHSFTNHTASPVSVIEVFVKPEAKTAGAARNDASDAMALALAALAETAR